MAEQPFLGPVVEKPGSDQSFLTEAPINLLKSGKYNKVPLMIGFTTREGMLGEIITKLTGEEFKGTFDFEQAVPYFLGIPKESDIFCNTVQRIRNFYYGKEEPTLKNVDRYYLVRQCLHVISLSVNSIYCSSNQIMRSYENFCEPSIITLRLIHLRYICTDFRLIPL